MKNIFKPRITTSDVEVEITNLEKRRTEIVMRIGDAELALEQAREERREILSTTGDFDGITKRVSGIANQLADLKTVLVDVDAQGADAMARLTKARDKAERAASAEGLEKTALAVEERIPELDKAVSSLSKVVAALRKDLSDTASFWETHLATRPAGSVDSGEGKATAREIAAAVVAEVIAKAMPWAFDVALAPHGYSSGLFRIMAPHAHRPDWISDSPAAPISAAEIVQALVSAPLRERADAIKLGDAEVENPGQRPAAADDYVRPVAPASVSVFVLKAFKYIGTEFGPPLLCGEGWTQSVPLPVAELAERQALAVRATSARGEALIAAARNLKGRSDTRVRPEDCIDLADVMGLRSAPSEISGGAAA